jgi:glucose-1-phosphate adenylyltransferase
MLNVLSIVLGGGKGTRLYPLTKSRAKPAVPFGSKYRIVDIPISNSINSGFKKIYVLTQFNSASLHLHILNTYIFDSFTRGFVEILAAEQTFDHSGWYEGTADAVRKNFVHFRTQEPSHYLILSGDQLYRMNLADFYQKHLESGADVSIAATPVTRKQATGFGIVRVNYSFRVEEFLEKPPIERDVSYMKIPDRLRRPELEEEKKYLASMGIYFFKAHALEAALDNGYADFGREILPNLIEGGSVHTYVFNGFWEDIGTIKSFYETNLDLASPRPAFNFYDEKMPIYTHKRDLPASKFNSCTVRSTLAADGCVVTEASIDRSIIGIRTIVGAGAELNGVVCMGADYYETEARRQESISQGIPQIGIGAGTRIRGAIIDKNARIGENCRIGLDAGTYTDGDYEGYYVRDGIIVIPKNGLVRSGTVI